MIASINGVPLHAPGQAPDSEALRQRACTELLRQAAQAAGLLDPQDRADETGVISEPASEAIEALLQRELVLPEPDEAACRRHHAAHAARYATGERLLARHILFGVTPGTDLVALRRHAEGVLLELRAHGRDEADGFAAAARRWSNCPSGAEGGELGWLSASDCANEFARELFGHSEIGVLPRLVHSRFGLHLVEVLQREHGRPQPYESVSGAVALALRQQAYVTALRHYLLRLAGAARIAGVDLQVSDQPPLQ